MGGVLEAVAPPSGFERDLGADAPPPSLVKDVADVILSPFGVFPASHATKTTADVLSGTSFEAAPAPPGAATFEAAAPLWILLS